MVFPDLSFIEARAGQLAGLAVTHAHEDHIGGIVHLWHRLKCPIYATPLAANMIKQRSVWCCACLMSKLSIVIAILHLVSLSIADSP